MSTDAWIENAICATTKNPGLWFSNDPTDIQAAKAVCRRCPVSDRCLAGAVERDERWGVWGGLDLNRDLDVNARRKILRKERRAKRTCDWCSETFRWEPTTYERAPAYCSDECDREHHLARNAELYRDRLDATG